MTTETPRWFTSSYSSNGGACVEIASNLAASHGTVPMRDTKDRTRALAVGPRAFSHFVSALKSGRLDG